MSYLLVKTLQLDTPTLGSQSNNLVRRNRRLACDPGFEVIEPANETVSLLLPVSRGGKT